MIKAHILGQKIVSNSEEAYSINEKSSFGEKKEGNIEYPLIESLFLLKQKKIEIISGKKVISFHELLKKASKQDKKIELKLSVYEDLRKKGYTVKSALKFGTDFRIYEKGVKPSEDHAPWLLVATREGEKIDWQEFAAKNRIAHSTRKKLLIAIVDEESDVSYYEISWLKL